MNTKRTFAVALGAVVLSISVASMASAAAPGPGGGKGTSLCQPVPAVAITFPAGGPAYNFLRSPPSAFPSFERVCSS